MVRLDCTDRVWLITDLHFGVRNSLEEWIEIQRDYFLDYFIPLVKREYRPGDVLFVLGDVFDSRHAITLKVLNMAIDVFEELGAIFKDGVYVIAGNHDCWMKSSNSINSLRTLKWLPNIHVYDNEPGTIEIKDKKFLMMPWRKNHESDIDAIRLYGPGHDYMMCHMDVYGMRSSRFAVTDYGISTKAFQMFNRVYSGHIHYAQRESNVVMLGTPYELTRADMYNEKGVTVLDVATGKEIYFVNDYSPHFISISMSEMLELSPKDLRHKFDNNFVDIRIDNPNFLRIPINSILDLLEHNYRSITFIPPNAVIFDKQDVQDEELRDFDIRDSIKTYCDNTPYDEDTKKKLNTALLKLLEKATEDKDR